LQEMFPFQGASNGAYRNALFLLKICLGEMVT